MKSNTEEKIFIALQIILLAILVIADWGEFHFPVDLFNFKYSHNQWFRLVVYIPLIIIIQANLFKIEQRLVLSIFYYSLILIIQILLFAGAVPHIDYSLQANYTQIIRIAILLLSSLIIYLAIDITNKSNKRS